jgi:hypothetical protein
MTANTRGCTYFAIGVVVLALAASSVAEANTIIPYTISGTLADGGSLTGSFTIDWTTDTVTSAALNTSAGPNPSFPGQTFTVPVLLEEIAASGPACQTNCDLGVRPNPAIGFDFLGLVFQVGSNFQLTFLPSFSVPLAAATSTEVNQSGLRLITAATITADVSATPLPAAFPLFASGLGALGLLGWRRKRKAPAAIA